MGRLKGTGLSPNAAPSEAELLEVIRRLAASSGNVWFSAHAEDRMDERGITDLDVLRVLRSGHVKGSILPGANEGEWKCKIVAGVKGRREIGVVTLVIRNRRLKVKTVEWEDLR